MRRQHNWRLCRWAVGEPWLNLPLFDLSPGWGIVLYSFLLAGLSKEHWYGVALVKKSFYRIIPP